MLYDFSIRKDYQDGRYLIHSSPPIDTGVDHTSFNSDLCKPYDVDKVVDISDVFETELIAMNYHPAPFHVDWTNTSMQKFDSDVILKFSVGQTTDTGQVVNFKDIEVFITDVTVTLRDPQDLNSIISRWIFTAENKKNSMWADWLLYYKDPRFCRYYDKDDITERCNNFFIQDKGRWNKYNTEVLSTVTLDQQCQNYNNRDNKNIDYFLFTPQHWFLDNIYTAVNVEFQVTAKIHKCGAASSRRLLSGEYRPEFVGGYNPEDILIYVTDSIVVSFNEETGEIIDSKKIEKDDVWDNKYGPLVLGLIISGFVLLCMFISFGSYNMYKYRHYSDISEIPIASVSYSETKTSSMRIF
jgi:hypothetical protein